MSEINFGNVPSNSINKKKEESRPEPIVKGKVTKTRVPFFKATPVEVGSYVLKDIILPCITDAIYNLVTNTVGSFLYGIKGRPGSTTRMSSGSTFNYNKIYSGSSTASTSSQTSGFREVCVDTMEQAENVIDALMGVLERQNCVTVAQYYDMVGIDRDWSMQGYGWTDLREAKTRRVREGIIIDLPNPKKLN